MKSKDAKRLPDRDQQSPESTPTCCHGSQDHTLLWNNYCCQLGGLLKPGARNSQDDHNQQKDDMRTQMSLFKATACNYSFFWTDLLSCKQKQHLGRSTTMNFLGTINFFNPNGILLVNSTFLSHCQTGVWDSVGSPSCCIDNFSDQSQAVRLYVCTLPLKTLFLVTSKCFCKNPVSFVSIILDRFTIVYCWSGDGASRCVHRPTLGQRSKPVSCLAPLLEIVPFVWLHVKTIITKNIPPFIISTPWVTLRTCV